jgi:hypothetical protein
MKDRVPEFCSRIAQIQSGVISRRQALEYGLAARDVEYLLRSGRWQPLQRGVYATFTGSPSRTACLWAAVLLAGPGAALSHQTAAELFEITDWRSAVIHLTIPAGRTATAPRGIVIHRSTRVAEAVHSTLVPPRTKLDETVLDLVDLAPTFEEAFSVTCGACQRRRTTAKRLGAAMSRRARLRWRGELTEALGLIDAGVHSLLEYRYVSLVERPHGLPTARRQAELRTGRTRRYLDNLYDDYDLCVELDGQQAHPEEQRWADLQRINSITEEGLTVLRYGWREVNNQPCETAAQIVAVLHNLGWKQRPRPCRPGCPIR